MSIVVDARTTSARCAMVDMATHCELKGELAFHSLGTESRVEPAHRCLLPARRMGSVASQPNRKRRDGLNLARGYTALAPMERGGRRRARSAHPVRVRQAARAGAPPARGR